MVRIMPIIPSKNPITINPVNGAFTLTPKVLGGDFFTYNEKSGGFVSVSISLEGAFIPKFNEKSTLIQSPEYGTATLNKSGSFTYTPLFTKNGVDFITYKIDNGKDSCLVKLIIHVTANAQNATFVPIEP